MSGSAGSPVVTTLAVDDANFRKALSDAAALLQGYLKTNESAARALAAAGAAGTSAAGTFNNVGHAAGQAGFQIQDFAVQVQGGTSALTALSQQGSQLLGIFGTGGAIAGAALTVGILITQLVGLGKEAETLTDIIKKQDDAYKSIKQSADAWHNSMVDEQADLLKLQAYYTTLTESVRIFERERLRIARNELNRQGTTLSNNIISPGSGVLAQQEGEMPIYDALGNNTGGVTGVRVMDPRVVAFSEALRVFREGPLSTQAIADLSGRMTALSTGSDQIAERANETVAAINKAAGDVVRLHRAMQQLDGQGEALSGRVLPLPPDQMPMESRSGGGSRRQPEQYGPDMKDFIASQRQMWGEVRAEIDKTTKGAGDLTSVGREFSTVFTSAFDGLITKGGKFADVLERLGTGLARIIERQFITKPLESALTGFFGNGAAEGGSKLLSGATSAIGDWFSGLFRAEGGPVMAGSPYIVGEQGPELFMPQTSGSIIPNGSFGGGGVSIAIDARGADQGVEARLDAMLSRRLPGILAAAHANTVGKVNRGGADALAFGRRGR